MNGQLRIQVSKIINFEQNCNSDQFLTTYSLQRWLLESILNTKATILNTKAIDFEYHTKATTPKKI